LTPEATMTPMKKCIVTALAALTILFGVMITGLLSATPALAATGCSPWSSEGYRFLRGMDRSGHWHADRSLVVGLEWRTCRAADRRYGQARARAHNYRKTGKTDFAIALKLGRTPFRSPTWSRAWHPRIPAGSTWRSRAVDVERGYGAFAWVEAHTHYRRRYQDVRDYWHPRDDGLTHRFG
jgi:hypothetical protein